MRHVSNWMGQAGKRSHAEAPLACCRQLVNVVVSVALLFAAASRSMCQSPTASTIYSFSGLDGSTPYAGLIQASDGNLYGTTQQGGANGNGTVFKMTPAGKLTTLHSFSAFRSTPTNFYTNRDGANPWGNLIQATDGNLYGTTYSGGAGGWGTIFRLTRSGVFTTLHSFSGPSAGADGGLSYAGLVQATDGNLYGTTYSGGTDNNGTVYQITTSGIFTTIYSFPQSMPYTYPNGNSPQCTLIQATDGNLYGTTRQGGLNDTGTVFRITTGGALTTLYSFSSVDPNTRTNTDGGLPWAGLVQATDGNLYGTTEIGGANGSGTIFGITTGGALTMLHSFTDGAYPWAALIQAADGNLYGTTEQGGTMGEGSIFQINRNGAYNLLYSFNGSIGVYPWAGLVQATDGNLYGTARAGGASFQGSLYKVNGIYPLPTLLSLSPASCNAGAPAFTLTASGASFQTFSTINWNGKPLTTHFVSASTLTATVPAALVATAGKASITVVTGAGGGTSNAKTFAIPLTTLTFTSALLNRNSDGSYTATLTLNNTGYNTAANVLLTQSKLGAAATTTPLPLSVGALAAGAAASITLNYPASAGAPGRVVVESMSGSFTGGTFSVSSKVTLP